MARPEDEPSPRPVRWAGSSRDDLRGFPEEVRNRVGGALWEAQLGRKAPYAKPLKGLHSRRSPSAALPRRGRGWR